MTVIRATGSQLATQASVRGSASELELRASGFAQHARVLHPRYTGHAAEEQTRPLYTTLLHAPRSSITLNSSKPATLPLSEVFGAFTPRPALFQEGLQHTCAACQHRAYTGAQSACRQRCGSLLLQSMAQLCCTCLKGARASPPLHLTAPLMARMLCRPYAAGTTLWEPAEQAAGADADIGLCATVGGASRLRAGLPAAPGQPPAQSVPEACEGAEAPAHPVLDAAREYRGAVDAFLQSSCRQWLHRLLGCDLPPDAPLAQLLASGRLLCALPQPVVNTCAAPVPPPALMLAGRSAALTGRPGLRRAGRAWRRRSRRARQASPRARWCASALHTARRA